MFTFSPSNTSLTKFIKQESHDALEDSRGVDRCLYVFFWVIEVIMKCAVWELNKFKLTYFT